jgi:poly-gamma-glutamate capsule biosynthesis protein CapA/YwtB (metallophosphatase superfamily)
MRGRRRFLQGVLCMAGALGAARGGTDTMTEGKPADRDRLTLFLSGDVMTGRGLDQIMPHPVGPRLYEPYVKDARAYVELAEQVNGPISRPVAYDYIWGDALSELRRRSPGASIINLETSVTTSDRYWRDKGIHYRMHPRNLRCLRTAGIDCCVLANNHVLDWGYAGLQETLDSLQGSGLQTAGAGMDETAAAAPALLQAGAGKRVVVFSFAHVSSGVPGTWKATAVTPGVNLLPDLTTATAERIGQAVAAVKAAGDVVLASIHWGGNWGYGVPKEHRGFAHWLIDHAGIDVVHGHSSHHPLGLEIHHGRPVLYGCGDLLNDYEGIRGYEEYRPDLALMYFVTLNAADGELAGLDLVPMRMARMRLNRASRADAEWLRTLLNREGRDLGTAVDIDGTGTLRLDW